jgi:hypothetical protein
MIIFSYHIIPNPNNLETARRKEAIKQGRTRRRGEGKKTV